MGRTHTTSIWSWHELIRRSVRALCLYQCTLSAVYFVPARPGEGDDGRGCEEGLRGGGAHRALEPPSKDSIILPDTSRLFGRFEFRPNLLMSTEKVSAGTTTGGPRPRPKLRITSLTLAPDVCHPRTSAFGRARGFHGRHVLFESSTPAESRPTQAWKRLLPVCGESSKFCPSLSSLRPETTTPCPVAAHHFNRTPKRAHQLTH